MSTNDTISGENRKRNRENESPPIRIQNNVASSRASQESPSLLSSTNSTSCAVSTSPKAPTSHQTTSTDPITAERFLAKPSEYTTLPEELKDVDFTQRISWRKYAPYPSSSNNTTITTDDDDDTTTKSCTPPTNLPLPLTPISTPPQFPSSTPALCFHVHAIDGRARATTLHLPPVVVASSSNDTTTTTTTTGQQQQQGRRRRQRNSIPTPMFMPVGTKGTIKALTTEEICDDPALDCPIILANTYHLALQPGTELVRDVGGGIHRFMAWDRPILTDSGGFQMVSLLKFAEITEEGVTFENPFDAEDRTTTMTTTSPNNTDITDTNPLPETGTTTSSNNIHHNDETTTPNPKPKKERLLLRPEDSIHHQNNIGSDIIMALDDVVSSVASNPERFLIATYRTLRWLDRCYAAHAKPKTQNLFAIVQGGLDVSLGGLREKCLAGFRVRDERIPGYAIGGLAGGESKDDFWKVVDCCCRALPDDKPRYLMGVGYPLDLVVCTALGVDMYDCVYPTRTARFGVALVGGDAPGTMRLKANEYGNDERVIMEGCECQACKGGYSRARLHGLLKNANPLAASLMTSHNIAYMMTLVRGMRTAIMEGRYGDYVRGFVSDQFRGKESGGQDVPTWVREALAAGGIEV